MWYHRTVSQFGPATYGNAFADVYDAWYGTITDADATAAFVAARSPQQAPVLELGVGTGRLVPALLATGRPVVGVDASKKMLDLCRAIAPRPAMELLLGDLGALPLRPQPRFGAALCAFNTLFNVPTEVGQQAFFDCIAACLLSNGALIIEALTGYSLGDGPPSSIGVSRADADRLVLSSTVLNGAQQTIRGQHVDLTTTGEIVVRPWQLRWSSPEQLDAMAASAGLTLAERCGDWDGRPWSDDDPSHITVYRLAT